MPIENEVALPKEVHSEQRIELECLGKLKADHIVKHKRERRLFGGRDNPDSEQISLGLPFALRRA